jgi:hypothetical protein
MKHLDVITWHAPAETWRWPFTADQWARLTNLPCSVDGRVQVLGIGPDCPDLIVAVGYAYLNDLLGESETGDPWLVRFGEMSLVDYEALPEHGGW